MKGRLFKTSICLVTAILLSAPAVQAADSWELEQVMASMAAEAVPAVTYREEKRFVFLEQELVTTGVLRFQEPDTLIREVTSPDRGVYTARGTRMVIIEEGREEQEVDLAEHPGALIFMETFKAVLKGDLRGLEKHYRVSLSGRKISWALDLVPLDEQVLQYVESITLTGRGGRVKRIETREVGGDSSLMVFEPHVD